MAEFAAGASHEINNPLAVISGHAQMLLAAESDPERRRQLETIIRQTRRVHELLKGTLQFAKPPRPRLEWLAFSTLIESVREELAAEAALKSVDLQVVGPLPSGLGGRADRGQVRQALIHLVRNAIDAVPTGGWVGISLECRGQTVALCVDDNGPGPDPADVEHLFDPFYSGRSAGRGRGLGLSIAWRLARINGAAVRYGPDVGPATRFELVIRAVGESGLTLPFPERRSA
jgi:signal transduction histidine kinase